MIMSLPSGWDLASVPVEVATVVDRAEWERPLLGSDCAALRMVAVPLETVAGVQQYIPPVDWYVGKAVATGGIEEHIAWFDPSGKGYLPDLCGQVSTTALLLGAGAAIGLLYLLMR